MKGKNAVTTNHQSGNVMCDILKAHERVETCELALSGPIRSLAPSQNMEILSKLTVAQDVCINGNLVVGGRSTFDTLRQQNPNEPEKLGTSRSLQARSYSGYPFQAGSEFGTGLKLELDSEINKATVSNLDVSITFDLVPSTAEAGVMDSEIINAGFVGPFAARANNWSWYGVTCDDTNFYYQVGGGPNVFATIFGFGTNSLFVCRRKSDAKLVWVKNCRFYDLVTPGSTNYVGGPFQPARTTLAIHKDRLYATTMLTNLGPQLYCINKNTGDRIWTMLYDVPLVAGGGIIVTPMSAFGSVNPAPYAGSNVSVGDLNIVVKELSPGVASIFVGTSSFQNAVNTDPIWGNYTDQGKLIRVDDAGTTASRTWVGKSCVRDLVAGETISAGNMDPELDPFRPGETEVLIWRDSTTGTFVDGSVIGKVLDNTGPHPGFRPMGYTGPGTANNLTMPAMQGKLFTAGDLPLTEASFNSLFRSPAPGVGAGVRIYQRYAFATTNISSLSNAQVLPQSTINVNSTAAFPTSGSITINTSLGFQTITYTGKTATTFTGCLGGTGTLGTGGRVEFPLPIVAKTISDVLLDLNAALPTVIAANPAGFVVVYIWCYLSGAEITAVDGAAGPFLTNNIGTRYMAALPTPHTLTTQEAKALNYYGNSFWAQTPVIDMNRNMIYAGTGQAHFLPADEELYFQQPSIDFRDRAQSVVNTMYEYTQNDTTLSGAGPFASITDLNNAKDTFTNDTRTLILNAAAMSPRGRRSYSDAIVGFNLTTGAMEFGIRTLPSDIANFNNHPTVIFNTSLIGPDGDVSSGVQLFESVRKTDGKLGQFLSTCNKAGIICNIDISGLNAAVPWNHNNALLKGLDPQFAYAGALSALGGSNYGSCQSGGQYLIYMSHNMSTDVDFGGFGGSGVRSRLYTSNNFQGWEFHVTRDGDVYQIRDSVLAAYDVGKNEIAWEINIGQLSFGYPTSYNGAIIMCTTEGLLVGYDVADGHKILSRDLTNLGLGGVASPIFDQGVGYAVCNYVGTGHGKLGNTGLILKVSSTNTISNSANVNSLLGGFSFSSYDVIPKKAPISTQAFPLIEPETISHVWSSATNPICTAIHTPSGGVPESITVTAQKYYAADKTISFVDSGTVTATLRYKYIEMLNAKNYILFYQRLQNGVWVDHRATCQKL